MRTLYFLFESRIDSIFTRDIIKVAGVRTPDSIFKCVSLATKLLDKKKILRCVLIQRKGQCIFFFKFFRSNIIMDIPLQQNMPCETNDNLVVFIVYGSFGIVYF
jgi:hypothetical protein